jgi:hypothetical protein
LIYTTGFPTAIYLYKAAAFNREITALYDIYIDITSFRFAIFDDRGFTVVQLLIGRLRYHSIYI